MFCPGSTWANDRFGIFGAAKNVEAELLFENEKIEPGKTFWAGVKFKLGEGWHIYWHNVGSTGLPTKLKFDVPEGVHVGELAWPVPERFSTAGSVSFGYHDETMLMFPVTLDTNKTWGNGYPLKSKQVGWSVKSLASRVDKAWK